MMGVRIVFDGEDASKEYTGLLILHEPNTGIVHLKSHKLSNTMFREFLLYALDTVERNQSLPNKDEIDEIQEVIDKYKDD